ncbi:MAG: peptidase T, partial [Erysipelotrichaceae bacterium]|nr:peptidase T [Erysipelotrichaceae bacterium]
MNTLERFLDYVTYDTQSDPTVETVPTTAKQKVLGQRLVNDLKEIGLQDAYMDEHGYVYASLKGNTEGKKAVGFVAHMDTSPDYSGYNVKPVILNNYDGKDIVVNGEVVTAVKDYPELAQYVGKTMVVTDGSTLLGADDKAGVAIILSAMEYLVNHPEVPHGDVHVGFTPDEEVGLGASLFDVKGFHCDFAYTVDGGAVDCIDYENFNAAHAVVTVQGNSIHPGSAKDKMVNAIHVAEEFDAMLPVQQRPEHTSGYEGFYHLMQFNGTVDGVTLEYIIRNHSREQFEQMKSFMMQCTRHMQKRYTTDTITTTITDTYYNMKECFAGKEEVVEYARRAIS